MTEPKSLQTTASNEKVLAAFVCEVAQNCRDEAVRLAAVRLMCMLVLVYEANNAE